MTILVGTDFSTSGTQAVDIAAELARARGAQLIVLHLVEGAVQAADRERMTEEEARLTNAEVKPPLRVRALLEAGPVGAARFAEVVDATRPDLLVIGAHGDGMRRPLGTLAQAVIRKVTVPLLVVRAEARLLGLVFQRPLRVMATLALDDTDDGVREAVRWLEAAGALEVELVHYRSLPENTAAAHSAQEIEHDVRAAFGAHGPRCSVRGVHVRDGFGRIDAHLVDLAARLDVDLIVAGSHHRHGVDRLKEGSVAEGLIGRAPVSVLVGRASR